MLISAINGSGVSAGADRQRETALRSSNSRHLPAAYDRILHRVHAAAEFLASPNRQVIDIVENQRVWNVIAVNGPIRFQVVEVADTRGSFVAVDGAPFFRATHIGEELREGVGGREQQTRAETMLEVCLQCVVVVD